MHPVIRIFTFLVLAVLLARAHPMQMGWVLLVIGLAFLFEKGKGISAIFRLLWRVRWLLLSILLVYVWLPIGTLYESLWLALHRIGILITLLSALQVLVLNMPRDDIVMGLYAVLWPLCLFGLSREKTMLRLVLTMESISQLPAVLKQQVHNDDRKVPPLGKISERLVNAISRVLAHGENVTHPAVSIETEIAVPPWQWALPILVVIVFFGLSVIG